MTWAIVAACKAGDAPVTATGSAAAGSAAKQEPTTGVTDTTIVVGEPAAFTGPSAALGIEFWRGAAAAFAAVNDAGGIAGRTVELVAADDAYDPERAAPAVVELVERDRAFVVFGGVGTPTIVRALPVVRAYFDESGLFYFANFTGAQPQRRPPNARVVFNVRASYYEETAAIVGAFLDIGKSKIGVFLQDDAYGIDGREGVVKALAARGGELAAEARYPRGQMFATPTTEQVQLLRAAGVDAVVMVGSYQACAAFVRDARRGGWDVPIAGVSFVGADQLLGLFAGEGDRDGLIKRLVITQVVPHYDDTSVAVVRDYRAAIDKYAPIAPPIGGAYKPARKYTFGSLEGYVSARALALVLAKAGRGLTRRTAFAAAEAMGSFDLGLGVAAELSATRHQALDRVWFTYATPTGWKPTDKPAEVLR